MIVGFVGTVGAGKTANMVALARERMKATACQVYSMMGSLRFPRAVYLDSECIEQISQVRNGLILCDEAGVVLNGRFWQTTSRDTLSAIAQSRHNGIDLWYTAQYEEQVDKGLREITSETIRCRPLFGRWVLLVYHQPGQKRDIIRRRLRQLGAPDWYLYDTLEIIGRDLGAGIGYSRELERVRERRSRSRRGCARRGAVGYYRARGLSRFRSFWGVSQASEKAWLDLKSDGIYPGPGESWRDLVVQELGRREWLSDFKLRPSDVGADCRIEFPWEPGFDPWTVKDRTREERELDKLESEEVRDRREMLRRARASVRAPREVKAINETRKAWVYSG